MRYQTVVLLIGAPEHLGMALAQNVGPSQWVVAPWSFRPNGGAIGIIDLWLVGTEIDEPR